MSSFLAVPNRDVHVFGVRGAFVPTMRAPQLSLSLSPQSWDVIRFESGPSSVENISELLVLAAPLPTVDQRFCDGGPGSREGGIIRSSADGDL